LAATASRLIRCSGGFRGRTLICESRIRVPQRPSRRHTHKQASTRAHAQARVHERTHRQTRTHAQPCTPHMGARTHRYERRTLVPQKAEYNHVTIARHAAPVTNASHAPIQPLNHAACKRTGALHTVRPNLRNVSRVCACLYEHACVHANAFTLEGNRRLSDLSLSYPIRSHLSRSYPIRSDLIRSDLIRSDLILSDPISFHPILCDPI
jgi:hypothetical protein